MRHEGFPGAPRAKDVDGSAEKEKDLATEVLRVRDELRARLVIDEHYQDIAQEFVTNPNVDELRAVIEKARQNGGNEDDIVEAT